MGTLNRLEEWSELPDELYVLEFGVGDGQQAQVWLDAFARCVRGAGRDYLERLRYVMADYSPHVLEVARRRVADYERRRAARARLPQPDSSALAHLRGKVLFAHTCNLYDNLPTDELMRVGDRAYEPLVRASITPGEVARDLAAPRHRRRRDRRGDPGRPAPRPRV